MTPHSNLSRRERQIMDVIYEKGRATAFDVMDSMPDPPGYSSIRSTLTSLEEKGYLRHEKQGPKYLYIPIVPFQKAKRSAIQHLIRTFFGGSREQAVRGLLEASPAQFSDEELDRMAQTIEKFRKRK